MSTAAAPQPSTARTLLHDTFHRSRLAIGDPVLDQALDGLDVAGGLTEIAGEAGTGKTQLALQLMLQAQLPSQRFGGLGGGALYLHGDTSNVDPALKRLHTIASAFATRHAALGADVERLKAQIYVLQIDSPDDLWHVVDERLPTFLNEQAVRLIVVDSLAGMYRGLADVPAGLR